MLLIAGVSIISSGGSALHLLKQTTLSQYCDMVVLSSGYALAVDALMMAVVLFLLLSRVVHVLRFDAASSSTGVPSFIASELAAFSSKSVGDGGARKASGKVRYLSLSPDGEMIDQSWDTDDLVIDIPPSDELSLSATPRPTIGPLPVVVQSPVSAIATSAILPTTTTTTTTTSIDEQLVDSAELTQLSSAKSNRRRRPVASVATVSSTASKPITQIGDSVLVDLAALDAEFGGDDIDLSAVDLSAAIAEIDS